MQNFGLVSDISVYENMKIVCNDIERIKEVLSEYGIGDKLKNSIYTLSGGEQQRVAIAMIELKNPDIILADEPTGNLDDENRDFIIGKFNDFQSKGKTIVIVTHDEEFLKHASQKIFL